MRYYYMLLKETIEKIFEFYVNCKLEFLCVVHGMLGNSNI